MNKFWGKTDNQETICKFSRDDDQLLALNYENICDLDYLSRIFGSDTQFDSNESKEPYEDLVTSGDICEDIVIFGDDLMFGMESMQKRNIYHLTYILPKNSDQYSNLIQKQVLLFRHLGRIIRDRCLKTSPLAASLPSPSPSPSPSITFDDPRNYRLGKSALLSTLQILEKKGVSTLRRKTVENILEILFSSLIDESKKTSPQSIRSLMTHLRTILSKGLASALDFKDIHSPSFAKIEELLQISGTCAYGMLLLGLYLSSPGDILIGFVYLLGYNSILKEIDDEFSRENIVIGPNMNELPRDETKKLKLKSKNFHRDSTPANSQSTSIANSRIMFAGSGGSNNGFSNPNNGLISTGAPLSGNGGSMGMGTNELGRNSSSVTGTLNGNGCHILGMVSSGGNGNIGISNNSNLNSALTSGNNIPINSSGVSSGINGGNNGNIGNNGNGNGNNVSPSNSNNLSISNSHNDIESPSYRESFQLDLGKLGTVKNLEMGHNSKFSIDKETSTKAKIPISKIKLNNEILEGDLVHITAMNIQVSPKSNGSLLLQKPLSNQVKEPTVSLAAQQNEENSVNSTETRKKIGKQLEKVLMAASQVPNQILKLIHQSNIHLFEPHSSRSSIQNSSPKTTVWSCGQNSYSELGHGDIIRRKEFSKIASMDSKSIINIGAGNEHTLLLSSDGKIFVCGYNAHGQCGIGQNQQVRTPTMLQGILETEEISQIHVYNGCEHSLAISKDGKVFAFGYNCKGQLGLGGNNSEGIPRPIKALLSRKVILASCSYNHSIFLCSDGSLFSSGQNDFGQLGHGDSTDKKTPHLVTHVPKNIVGLSCGHYHSCLLTNEGHVYVCGKNDYGQLGIDSDIAKVFTRITTNIESEKIVQVACGYFHNLLLSSSGSVFGFGRNENGQLGMNNSPPLVKVPTLISSLRDKNVIGVCTGCYHSVVTTSNGMLYVFGRNNYGQLGTGDLDDRHIPHPVDEFLGKKIIKVSAGFYHTILLVTENDSAGLCGNDGNYYNSFSSSNSLDMLTLEARHSVQATPNNESVENNNNMAVSSNNSLFDFLTSLNQPGSDSVHNLAIGSFNEADSSKAKGSRFSIKYSLDSHSRFSMSDLFLFVIERIKVFVSSDFGILGESQIASPSPGQSHQISFAEFHNLTQVIRAISTIIELCRGILTDGLTFDIPLSPDESFRLLKTAILLAQSTLSQYRDLLTAQFARVCEESSDGTVHSEGSQRSFSGGEHEVAFGINDLLNRPHLRIFTPSDIIKEILHWNIVDHSPINQDTRGEDGISSSKYASSNSSTSPHNGNLDLHFKNSILRLRQELFSIYFHFQFEQDCLMNNDILETIRSTITKSFDVLFPNIIQSSQLFKTLGAQLVAPVSKTDEFHESSFDIENETADYSRCLMLFTCMCFKYRGIDDVIKVFSTSIYHGLQIFQQILGVFNHLSLVCFENVGDQYMNVKMSEIFNCINNLEHCTSNFSKVSIPLILTPATGYSESSAKANLGSIFELGESILRDILNAGAQILDLTSSRNITENIAFVLRNCTVIPTILPTVMLYGIANSPTLPLLDYLIKQCQNLTLRLQHFSVDHDTQKSVLFAKAPNNGTSTSPNHLKKDLAGLFPSWSRLLKISIILTSKLSNSLFENTVMSKEADPTPHSFFFFHKLWTYLSIPTNMDELIFYYQPNSPLASSFPSLSFSEATMTNVQKLRKNAFRSDFIYKSLFSSSLGTNVIEAIELIIYDIFYSTQVKMNRNAVDRQYYQKLEESVGFVIVKFVKKLCSNRSIILSSGSSQLTWKDALESVQMLISSVHRLLYYCHFHVSYVPFPTLAEKMSSRSKAFWKKALLIVIGVVRWRYAAKRNLSQAGLVATHFTVELVDSFTNGLTIINNNLISRSWGSIVENVTLEAKNTAKYISGLKLFESLLKENISLNIKIDVISSLVRGWNKRQSYLMHSFPSNQSARNIIQSCLSVCCSLELLFQQKKVILSLINFICDYIHDFLSQYPQGTLAASTSELTFLSLAVNFIHSVFVYDIHCDLLGGIRLSIAQLKRLLVILDDKCSLPSSDGAPSAAHQLTTSLGNSGEDATPISSVQTSNKDRAVGPKRINPRERNKALRKASNALILLIQNISIRQSALLNSSFQFANIDNLIQTNIWLCQHFQNQRLSIKMASSSETESTLGSASTSSSSTSSTIAHPSATVSNKELNPMCSAFSQLGIGPGKGHSVVPVSNSSNKKNCRDLITKPMEFCRSQEGFIVQSDKLIGGYKGVDFTLATWILLSQKFSNKPSFIMGKVSHNDAWPIVVLRTDNKLEIVYGHGNDFDKFSTLTTIQFSVWTHLCIVIEQKKIKVFINGVLDSSVSTKGNGKAVLYPLIVGACPQNIKTKLDSVREGFDGFLSSFKYYPRALSPIHVKFVFDQGPPESFDIRERWMYRLFSSIKILMSNLSFDSAMDPSISQSCAESLFMLFISDSGTRIQQSSLRLLQRLLILNQISDLTLISFAHSIGHSSGSNSPVQLSSKIESRLSSLGSLDLASNFHERICLYFLQLIGASLSSHLFVAMESEENLLSNLDLKSPFPNPKDREHSKFKEFIRFTPVILFDKSLMASQNATETVSLNPNLSHEKHSREDIVRELVAHVLLFLESLCLNDSKWSSAMECIINKVFCQSKILFQGGEEWSGLARINLLGAITFLSGSDNNGVFVGNNVVNTFSESVCRILSLNKSTNTATVLSKSSDFNRNKIFVLKINDLFGMPFLSPAIIVQRLKYLSSTIVINALELMNELKDFTKPLLGDLLSVDCNDIKSYLLRNFRPNEAFVFHQLLFFVAYMADFSQSSQLDFGLVSLRQQIIDFFKLNSDLIDHVIRSAIRLVSNSENNSISVESLSSSVEPPNMSADSSSSSSSVASIPSTCPSASSLSSLLLDSSRYLTSIPDRSIMFDYPSCLTSANLVLDFVVDNFGFRSEVLHNSFQDRLFQQGQFSELCQSSVANQDIYPSLEFNPLDLLLFSDNRVPLSDWTNSIPLNISSDTNLITSRIPFNDLSESDLTKGFVFIRKLRRDIISISRRFLMNFPLLEIRPFHPSRLPTYLLLWQACQESVILNDNSLNMPHSKENDSNIRSTSSLLLESFQSKYNLEVSKTIASSIIFTVTSLTKPKLGKANSSNGNESTKFSSFPNPLIAQTDILSRQLSSAINWLNFHENKSSEAEVCTELVRTLECLVPCDINDVHIQVIILCRFILKRLYFCLTNGHSIVNKNLLVQVNNDIFTRIRAKALELLSHEKSQIFVDKNTIGFHLTQLTVSLELVQRCLLNTSTKLLSGPLKLVDLPQSWSFPQLLSSKSVLSNISTQPPTIYNITSNSINISLTNCFNAIQDKIVLLLNDPSVMNSNGLLGSPGNFTPRMTRGASISQQLNIDINTNSFGSQISVQSESGTNMLDLGILDFFVIELSLAVNDEDAPLVFETIYCGNARDVLQTDLSSGCSYLLRARALFGGAHCSWSSVVNFQTPMEIPFSFDNLKSGPDIVLSPDLLSARYLGDDCWSSLLANRSFTQGVNTWQIRVIHSSTAYLFIGVATSAADLNTFLGGDSFGWGYIGEQALYHNREKVKVYGKSFSSGDIVEVCLNLKTGQLTFSVNGTFLGVAFENVFGELFPAVAFYNSGQEVSIIPNSANISSAHSPIPCSPSDFNMHEISTLNELIFSIHTKSSFSNLSLGILSKFINDWCSGYISRCRTCSGREIFLSRQSQLLIKFGLVVGERVRTPYGVAEVAGVAFGRIWFKFDQVTHGIWYFTEKQISSNIEKGYFIRCSYNADSSMRALKSTGSNNQILFREPYYSQSYPESEIGSNSITDKSLSSTASFSSPLKSTPALLRTDSISQMQFDSSSLQDLIDSNRWSDEMDSVLIKYLIKHAEQSSESTWDISPNSVIENFREIQQNLSRIVKSNLELSHRWGISGPKRRAVIARMGLLRFFNHLLEQYLPILIEDEFRYHKVFPNSLLKSVVYPTSSGFSSLIPSTQASITSFSGWFISSFTSNAIASLPTSSASSNPKSTVSSQSQATGSSLSANDATKKNVNLSDDSFPTVISILNESKGGFSSSQSSTPLLSKKILDKDLHQDTKLSILGSQINSFIPSTHFTPIRISTSWKPLSISSVLSRSSISSIRERIFFDIKMSYFWEIVNRTTIRPSKTEDDYDYPEDLPQIKINRLRGFRAREASELMRIPGEDLYLSSMFVQLWRELRKQPADKIRLTYTHPMDDGQSRSFKVKFDGEGVDDYGGPYRETLQQICDELQFLDPSQSGVGHLKKPTATANQSLADQYSNVRAADDVGSLIGGDAHNHMLNGGKSSLRCFIPLLHPTPNWTAGECNEKYKFMFHPGSTSPIQLELFRFLGQIVGIAIRSKVTLDLAFPSMLWKAIVGESLSERDILSFDEPSFNFIMQLSSIQTRLTSGIENPEFIRQEAEMLVQDLTWTSTRSDGRLIELLPNGSHISLSVDDIQQFLQLYVESRLTESETAIQAFREGLFSMIPEHAISLLTGEELEKIVVGTRFIDIQQLKDNTEYDDDVSPEDEHIQMFWNILFNDFSEDEKALFLRFVWARPTLPPKGAEFTQKFKIQNAVGDDANEKPDTYLPKAHTCFFSINLPKYTSKQIMMDKLRYAINNCTEMDSDFRLTSSDVVGWGVGVPSQSGNGYATSAIKTEDI